MIKAHVRQPRGWLSQWLLCLPQLVAAVHQTPSSSLSLKLFYHRSTLFSLGMSLLFFFQILQHVFNTCFYVQAASMLALAPPIQNNSSHTSSSTVSSGLAASTSRTRLSTRRAYSSSNPSFRSSDNHISYSTTPSSLSNPGIARTSSSVSLPVVTASDHQQGPQPPSKHADSRTNDVSSSQAPQPSSNQQPSHPSTPPPPTDDQQDPQPVEAPKPQPPPNFDIQTYPSTDLIRLLASLLTEIATANDRQNPNASLPPTSVTSSTPSSWNENPIWCNLFTASRNSLSTPTAPLSFHARNIPTISLESYLLRILRYCPTTNEVFLSLLVYFDRMSKLAKEATDSRFAIDSYNVHRLVIAGVTVASKFFSDVFYTNSRYAKASRVLKPFFTKIQI